MQDAGVVDIQNMYSGKKCCVEVVERYYQVIRAYNLMCYTRQGTLYHTFNSHESTVKL